MKHETVDKLSKMGINFFYLFCLRDGSTVGHGALINDTQYGLDVDDQAVVCCCFSDISQLQRKGTRKPSLDSGRLSTLRTFERRHFHPEKLVSDQNSWYFLHIAVRGADSHLIPHAIAIYRSQRLLLYRLSELPNENNVVPKNYKHRRDLEQFR
jgi:hypothetical protein